MRCFWGGAGLALLLAACGARQPAQGDWDLPPARAYEHAARAELYAARGAHERAQHELAIAIAMAPGDLYLRVRLAEETAAAGQPAAALDSLGALIRAAPRDPVPRIARARIRALRDAGRAAEDLEAALALSPDPATRREATLLYGTVSARAGRPAAGMGRLIVLAKARPLDLGVLIALAEAQAAAGEVAESFDTINRALVGREPRRPGTADLLVAWARLSYRRGDRAAAIAHARKALGGDPNHVGALIFLAHAMLDEARNPEAETLLGRARLLSPRDPAVLFVSARASGEPLEAERLLLQALGAGPEVELQEQIERRLGQAQEPAAAAASPVH